MIFREFGDTKNPVIILLHGGGLSWWSWQSQIDALRNDYLVITPIIDGHGADADTSFVSIEQCADQIISYIRENFEGKVFALCGLSIGAQIVTEMMSRQSEITQYAVIESALVYPLKATRYTLPLVRLCYGLVKKRWYAKLQAKTLNVSDDMFEDYFSDSSRMKKESLINITKSNGNYTMPQTLRNTTARALILVGQKELLIMKKSAQLLHDTIKDSELHILKDRSHGELSLCDASAYLDMFYQFTTNG